MIKGFVCGAFDLLHPGHVIMLKQCKDNCDYLLVGLHSDPSIDRPAKNKPVQTLYERYLQLKACKYVNNIIPYDTEKDLENMLAIEDINIRFVGEDYRDCRLTGHDICDQKQIEIIYCDRRHDYSSSNLRQRIKNVI
jgi:glycerol-3-phosphate cytidylyltransferase